MVSTPISHYQSDWWNRPNKAERQEKPRLTADQWYARLTFQSHPFMASKPAVSKQPDQPVLSSAAQQALDTIRSHVVRWAANGAAYYWTDWFMHGVQWIDRESLIELREKGQIRRREGVWEVNPNAAKRSLHLRPRPAATNATTKLTAAKPAREILRALRAGQHLVQVAGRWCLQRVSKAGHTVHKFVKAKWANVLAEAKCIIRHAREMILPPPSPAKRKADVLSMLAAKTRAKAQVTHV